MLDLCPFNSCWKLSHCEYYYVLYSLLSILGVFWIGTCRGVPKFWHYFFWRKTNKVENLKTSETNLLEWKKLTCGLIMSCWTLTKNDSCFNSLACILFLTTFIFFLNEIVSFGKKTRINPGAKMSRLKVIAI